LPTGKSFFSPALKPRNTAKPVEAERAPRTRRASPHHRGSAGEAFSTMGFEGASLRSVAKDAGVPHQLAIYYFKTKEEL
jgi:TetR/AcrR family transcriptional regulator